MPHMTAPIIAGAEPFSSDGGPSGVLVLHGFTGSPASVRPLAEALADAGFTVECPLLPGHGTSVEDILKTSWEDWSSAAEKSLTELVARCSAVAVAGLSMGGTLGAWLAERTPDIEGLVLVNPFMEAPDRQSRNDLQALVDAGEVLVAGIGSDIAMPGVKEISYEETPLPQALSLFDSTEEVAAALDRIRCPVLLLSSRNDHLVSPSSGDLLVAKVGGPCERVWLERSFHVATLDYDRDEVSSRAVDFLTRVLS